MNDQPVYVLKLRALPSGIPPNIRLRRALKLLLRACELRCVSVVEVKEDGQQGAIVTLPARVNPGGSNA
jgi:hypothetical protein